MHFLRLLIVIAILAGCKSSSEEKSAETASPRTSQVKSLRAKKFDYKPEAPVNGKLYATIEIGSSGLNYFIVNMDNQNRWSLMKSGFGESSLIDGEVDIDALFLKIESYKRNIINEGVPKKDIYVIASSSAIELGMIQEIKSRLSISGIKLKRINAIQEGYYDLLATVPKEFIEESFLVDIGSGNTKITWISITDTISLETYGSKYYLNGEQDTTVFRSVRDLLIEIPNKNRNLCFMLGGIPYEFAAATNNKQGRYTILEAPNKYSPSTKKGKSGKIIYDAVHLSPTYSYIFDWDSNFSIGYLISLENR